MPLARWSTLVSSADLLRALKLTEHDTDAAGRMARLLGFSTAPAAAEDTVVTIPADVSGTGTLPGVAVTVAPGSREPLRAQLPAITSCERIESPEQTPPPVGAARPLTGADCRPKCQGDPPVLPLVRKQRLWPAVKRSLVVARRLGIDVRRLSEEIARARPIGRLPLREHHWWGDELVVVWDRGERMTPYIRDYRDLLDQTVCSRGPVGLRLYIVETLPHQVMGMWSADRDAWSPCPAIPLPGRGATVLLLSDLGALSASPAAASHWQAFARSLRQAGACPVAWVPHSPRQVEGATAGLIRVHCLDRFGNLRPQRGRLRNADQRDAEHRRLQALREQLLTRLSFCIRVEPGLLREMRGLHSETAAEPALEGLTWSCRPVVRASGISRPLSPAHQAVYRERFRGLPAEEQRHALVCALRVHGWQGRSTGMLETLIWDSHADEAARGDAEKAALREAEGWIAAFRAGLQAGGETVREAAAFAEDLLSRNWQDHVFQSRHSRWLTELWALTRRADVPLGLDAVDVAREMQGGGTTQVCQLLQIDTRLVLWPLPMTVPSFAVSRLGSSWALGGVDVEAAATAGRRWIALEDEAAVLLEWPSEGTECRIVAQGLRYRITGMARPPWAECMGRDRFGLFADFIASTGDGGATQRLRWVEPGTFTMGSPEDEPERGSDEGPAHRVTISRGFWLADTACTQGLWQAVTGENPSAFTGDDQRPVERVSWYDVQDFLRKLEALLPGCQANLPTEAEWEYACRAGTGTPFSFGPSVTPEQVNYHGDFQYAGGQKGLYRQQTVPVKSLPPNPWGLYEMHGNVYEWCADGLRGYDGKPQIDPLGPGSQDKNAHRAVRGGSWYNLAGGSRSAFRIAIPPGDAGFNLGFRLCLRSIESGQAQDWPGGPAAAATGGSEPASAPPRDEAVTRDSLWVRIKKTLRPGGPGRSNPHEGS